MVSTGCCKDQFEPVKGLQPDRCGPVAPGSVRFKSKKGAVWTGCGSWVPLFGGKNRTEPDLYTLYSMQSHLSSLAHYFYSNFPLLLSGLLFLLGI